MKKPKRDPKVDFARTLRRVRKLVRENPTVESVRADLEKGKWLPE